MALKEVSGANKSEYSIRQARSRDIPHLASIELSASEAFRSIPELVWIAESGDTLPLSDLLSACKAKTLWVAVCDNLPVDYDIPVGFLCAQRLDQCLYINEVSVMTNHQGKGLGKRLLEVAEKRALALGLTRATLSTDREAFFNAPFYARRGFRETAAALVGPGHLAVVEKEEADGFDMNRRCVMIKVLDRGHTSHEI